MLNPVIDVLIDFLTAARDGGWFEIIVLFGSPIAAIFAVYRVTYRLARRRYASDITEKRDLEYKLHNREETLAERDAEIASLKRDVTALEELGPDHFLKTQEYNAENGNLEIELRDATDYLGRQEEALFVAHKKLADLAIYQASEDGAAGFETARLHALACLSLRPRDRELRELVGELEQASAAAASGAKVTLKEDTRDERRARRTTLPNDLAALSKCFYDARDSGRYHLMLAFADHGLRMAKRAGGEGTHDSLIFARHRAEAVQHLGRYSDALSDLRRIEPTLTTAFGLDHPESLYMRHLIALCLNDTGAATEALTALKALLPDRERVLGADHPHTLSTRYLIAQCLNDTGAATEALTAAKVLLPDEERVLGADHPNTLSTRSLITQCLKDSGAAEEALTAARALLPDRERVLGTDHPHTLATRYLIAQCLRDTGAAAEALTAAQALLPDRERVLGTDHPNMLTTRYLIAQCLKDSGAAAEALTAAQALLPDEERVHGADHPSTLYTRFLIASCLQDRNEASQALRIAEALLLDRERVSGKNHPSTLVARRLLADILLDLDRPDEARGMFEGILGGLRSRGHSRSTSLDSGRLENPSPPRRHLIVLPRALGYIARNQRQEDVTWPPISSSTSWMGCPSSTPAARRCSKTSA